MEFKILQVGIESKVNGEGISWGPERPIKLTLVGNAVKQKYYNENISTTFKKFKEIKNGKKIGTMALEILEDNYRINTIIKNFKMDGA